MVASLRFCTGVCMRSHPSPWFVRCSHRDTFQMFHIVSNPLLHRYVGPKYCRRGRATTGYSVASGARWGLSYQVEPKMETGCWEMPYCNVLHVEFKEPSTYFNENPIGTADKHKELNVQDTFCSMSSLMKIRNAKWCPSINVWWFWFQQGVNSTFVT